MMYARPLVVPLWKRFGRQGSGSRLMIRPLWMRHGAFMASGKTYYFARHEKPPCKALMHWQWSPNGTYSVAWILRSLNPRLKRLWYSMAEIFTILLSWLTKVLFITLSVGCQRKLYFTLTISTLHPPSVNIS